MAGVGSFANAGGVHVARALLAEFSENLAKVVSDSGDAAEPAAPEAEVSDVAPEPQPTPEPSASKQSAGELSASGLLWRIIKSKISQIFGKKG